MSFVNGTPENCPVISSRWSQTGREFRPTSFACVCVCVCVCVVGYMFLKMFVGGILKSFHVINIHRPHTYDYTCVNNISDILVGGIHTPNRQYV